MPGLIVTLQGNSSGYEAMLAKSVAQAKTAGGQIAVSMRQQIAALEVSGAGALPGSANSIAIASRLKAARLELAKDEAIQGLAIKRAAGVQLSLAEALRLKEAGLEYRSLATVAAETEAWKVEANRTAMEKLSQQELEESRYQQFLQEEQVEAVRVATVQKSLFNAIALKEFEAQQSAQVAATRVAQLAMLKAVAAGGTASAFGQGGGAGGGISGVMRETLVIFRELGRGNMTRVPGSLLLLLQYTGMLNLMMKSEKTEALLAAAAQEKLAQSTARAAMAAEAKLRSAKIAAGIDVSSPELKAAEAEMSTAAATAEEMRAEATTLAAAGETASADATAANILALEAERDAAIKAGVAETLRARETAAAAATIKASAATTLTAMGLMVLPVLLLVAAIVSWYIAIKELVAWMHKKNAAIAESMELADKYNTTVAESIDAEEKHKEALEKVTDALRKMNEEKDRTIKDSEDYIKALNGEYDAYQNLTDIKTKGKLLDVEISEKSGRITHQQAVAQKAQIESAALKDKADRKQNKLNAVAAQLQQDADTASREAVRAQYLAQQSGEGVANSPLVAKLAEAEKIKKISEEGAAEAGKEVIKARTGGRFGGYDGTTLDAEKNNQKSQESAEKNAEGLISRLRAEMSPAEIQAAELLTQAGEKTSAAKSLSEQAQTAATEARTNAANSPKDVAAEQANIAKQSKLDSLGGNRGGRMEVTDRERIGLGAASSVQVSMLDFTRKIEQHTRESKAILDYVKTHLQGNDGGFE